MIKALVAIALLAGSAAASAQLRTIPADAKRAQMSHVQAMIVTVDGRAMRLAPGGQIRDANNLVVLPSALPPGSLVKYVLDGEGLVKQAWILTPQEATQRDPAK